MGFPMRKAAERVALITAMLVGGLLYAGISQAQDASAPDGVQQERSAELAAAAGGPAPTAHLESFAHDAAAVDVRDDDVADNAPPASAAPGVAAPRSAPAAPHPASVLVVSASPLSPRK